MNRASQQTIFFSCISNSWCNCKKLNKRVKQPSIQLFYIIGLSRLNIYRWICHALIEDSLKTSKFTKDNYKEFLFCFFLFLPFYFFFAGNSHGYNKLSLWRGPGIIILSKFGLVARFYVWMCVYVFKGYFTLFSPPNERSDL